MTKNARDAGFPVRSIIAGTLAFVVAGFVALLSLQASAGDEKRDSAFRFYFAIPFIATGDLQPARLGFQMMSETGDGTTESPLFPDPEMRTALDLAFTRDGLAKFDVNGTDARPSYEMFARAIGLTPDEIELCRESDCLDWVKTHDTTVVPTARLAAD